MGFWNGLTSAMDDIRHKVVEEPTYGREVTGNIELPQQEPAVEPTSWQAAAQGIEPIQQAEPPERGLEMER
jgi:hypothetical protein